MISVERLFQRRQHHWKARLSMTLCLINQRLVAAVFVQGSESSSIVSVRLASRRTHDQLKDLLASASNRFFYCKALSIIEPGLHANLAVVVGTSPLCYSKAKSLYRSKPIPCINSPSL